MWAHIGDRRREVVLREGEKPCPGPRRGRPQSRHPPEGHGNLQGGSARSGPGCSRWAAFGGGRRAPDNFLKVKEFPARAFSGAKARSAAHAPCGCGHTSETAGAKSCYEKARSQTQGRGWGRPHSRHPPGDHGTLRGGSARSGPGCTRWPPLGGAEPRTSYLNQINFLRAPSLEPWQGRRLTRFADVGTPRRPSARSRATRRREGRPRAAMGADPTPAIHPGTMRHCGAAVPAAPPAAPDGRLWGGAEPRISYLNQSSFLRALSLGPGQGPQLRRLADGWHTSVTAGGSSGTRSREAKSRAATGAHPCPATHPVAVETYKAAAPGPAPAAPDGRPLGERRA
jgi:hypothetical protein